MHSFILPDSQQDESLWGALLEMPQEEPGADYHYGHQNGQLPIL